MKFLNNENTIVMLIMKANITITGLDRAITQVNSVRIESGNDLLTDVCMIKLPSSVENRTRNLEDKIKRGSPVSVLIGYDGYELTKFFGYVSRISPNSPMEIECEDASYLLKQVNLNKSWKPNTATLKTVLEYIVDETNKWTIANTTHKHQIRIDTDVPEVKFDKFSLVDVNGAQALEKLREEFGLTAYFVPDTRNLYVGLAYTANRGNVAYNMQENVISHTLKYRHEEDVKIEVEVTGVTKDNKRVTVKGGIAGGEKRTIFRYDVTDEKLLKQIADEEAKKLRYSGFEGDLTGFLIPLVQHGMSAKIVNPDCPTQEGTYHVDKVVSEFSENGGRNTVTIGVKI